MLKSRIPLIVAQIPLRVNGALKLGADGIAEGAEARVHVGPGDGPHLRDAIHVERKGPGGYYVIAGDDDVFWGHLEEFGTSHSAPHPFLVPAFEAGRDETVKLVVESLRGL